MIIIRDTKWINIGNYLNNTDAIENMYLNIILNVKAFIPAEILIYIIYVCSCTTYSIEPFAGPQVMLVSMPSAGAGRLAH